MAFTVAPTAGGPPYVLSAVVTKQSLIDDVSYYATLKTSSAPISCPARGVDSSLTPEQLNTLLTTGSVSTNLSVSAGSCRAFTLEILQVGTDSVVSSATVHVNNL